MRKAQSHLVEQLWLLKKLLLASLTYEQTPLVSWSRGRAEPAKAHARLRGGRDGRSRCLDARARPRKKTSRARNKMEVTRLEELIEAALQVPHHRGSPSTGAGASCHRGSSEAAALAHGGTLGRRHSTRAAVLRRGGLVFPRFARCEQKQKETMIRFHNQ